VRVGHIAQKAARLLSCLNPSIALSMESSQMLRSARSGSRHFWFALSPVFAGQEG
jgi:hypothetical protein